MVLIIKPLSMPTYIYPPGSFLVPKSHTSFAHCGPTYIYIYIYMYIYIYIYIYIQSNLVTKSLLTSTSTTTHMAGMDSMASVLNVLVTISNWL